MLQYYFGSKEHFYEYQFITDKDPDDLSSFYGSEDFMEIFCVMPFMGTLMMRGGEFDDVGDVHTTGFPGHMVVSMVFTDETSEEDAAADEDGAKWFNKRERFKDTLFGITMWDMIQNFGFHQLPDGRCVVYHYGEYYHGSSPPFSLLVRAVFQVHARWVAWATEHHVKHHAFTAQTDAEEAIEEESRRDMPLHLLKHHVWPDLKASLGFGKKKSTEEKHKHDGQCRHDDPDPSFLTQSPEEIDKARFKRQQKKILAKAAMAIEMDRQLEADAPLRPGADSTKDDEVIKASGIAIKNNPVAYQLATKAALSRMSIRKAPSKESRDSSKKKKLEESGSTKKQKLEERESNKTQKLDESEKVAALNKKVAEPGDKSPEYDEKVVALEEKVSENATALVEKASSRKEQVVENKSSQKAKVVEEAALSKENKLE